MIKPNIFKLKLMRFDVAPLRSNVTKGTSSLASLFPTAVLYDSIANTSKGLPFFGVRNDEAKQNIFLASNTLVYGIDNISAAAKIPPIVVLVPMWLEKVHPSHYGQKWVQTPLGLPEHTRTIFNKLYPNYPNNAYVTWKQILEVRNLQVENLEKLHKQAKIILHDLRSRDIKEYEQGKLLNLKPEGNKYIMCANGEPIIEISKDRLGKVYNFLSLPKEVSPEQRKLGISTRPHTELYYLDPAQIPKNLLIAGTGLSTVWLRKHFPTVKNFFAIAMEKDTELPKIPSNEEVDYDSIKLITKDEFFVNNETGDLAIQDPSTGRILIEYMNPSTCIYSALGFSPNTELTSCIPENYKITHERMDTLGIAPKNIPVGALTHRLMTFYYQSELYEDYNYVCELQFYTDGVTPMQLQQKLQEKKIELHRDFFTRLSTAIQKLDNPVDEEHEIELYMSAFLPQKPSIEEQQLFRAIVEEMQQEIKKRQQSLHKAHPNIYQSPRLQLFPYGGNMKEYSRLNPSQFQLIDYLGSFFKPTYPNVETSKPNTNMRYF
jgi:hypothetical protein